MPSEIQSIILEDELKTEVPALAVPQDELMGATHDFEDLWDLGTLDHTPQISIGDSVRGVNSMGLPFEDDGPTKTQTKPQNYFPIHLSLQSSQTHNDNYFSCSATEKAPDKTQRSKQFFAELSRLASDVHKRKKRKQKGKHYGTRKGRHRTDSSCVALERRWKLPSTEYMYRYMYRYYFRSTGFL